MRKSSKAIISILTVQTILLAISLVSSCKCHKTSNYSFVPSYGYHDVTEAVETPEPSSVALLSFGLVFLLLKGGN